MVYTLQTYRRGTPETHLLDYYSSMLKSSTTIIEDIREITGLCCGGGDFQIRIFDETNNCVKCSIFSRSGLPRLASRFNPSSLDLMPIQAMVDVNHITQGSIIPNSIERLRGYIKYPDLLTQDFLYIMQKISLSEWTEILVRMESESATWWATKLKESIKQKQEGLNGRSD